MPTQELQSRPVVAPGFAATPETRVDWEKPFDPDNPRDWSLRRKFLSITLVSLITFNTSLSTTIFSPSVPQLFRVLHNNNEQLESLSTSIFVTAFVFGPLVFAPLSEIYGRSLLLNCTNVLFAVFTIAAAVSTNLPQILVFRFFQGLWGCVPTTLGGGIIADLVESDQRGRALSIWQLGPLLGPVIGPIAGGYISEALDWRWTFWIVAIIEGVMIIASCILLPETYGPVLLEKKRKRLRKETNNPTLRTIFYDGRTKKDIFRRAILRPLKLLFRTPVVGIMALVVSTVYGYLYLLFTTFPMVFEEQYGFSEGASGLAYLGLGVGFIVGLIFTGYVSDRLTRTMTEKNGILKPEYRLPPLVVGAISVPIGLIWYGWTAEKRVHWIVPIIGTFFVGFGVLSIYMPIQAYLVDAFTLYAASASATNTVVRSIFGALVPLAGPPLYNSLGLGWGNTLLAFVALAMVPGPVLLIKYGEKVRTSPRFALDL
ncbi:MFS general substrate transporter [Nemania sp. FL0031]|nr:MFS general substrate transporter [Nemania sp. FL0031]